MRKAKIVCTLGPASKDPQFIGNLIDEGMNMARINFSHGDRVNHAATIAAVRSESQKRGVSVAVLQDLQGPKIRVGRFTAGQIELEPGADFLITTREIPGDQQQVSTTFKGLPGDVKAGDVLLLDDGLMSLEVDQVEGPDVRTRVLIGGILKNNKGINLPGVKVSAPALTEKDISDLEFGLSLGVDFVALSFVQSPEDVMQCKQLSQKFCGKVIPVIAKIEKPQAVDCLESIIDAADGIMIARGDLGVEMGPEKVPLIQKRAIEQTNLRGKVVITATQMLESMITNPRPTRAEASDVANAILDGTDAVMLSGETASGKYPLLAVRTMVRIVEEIETSARYKSLFESVQVDFSHTTNAIARAAVVAARQMNAKVIVCISESGAAARLVSMYRPEAPIVALTSPDVYHRLGLYWGVTPMLAVKQPTLSEMLTYVGKQLVDRGMGQIGDLMVVTVALPLGSGESTNSLHLHRL